MFAKTVVFLLSALACVQALTTPRNVRNAHHHRAVVARVAQPISGADAIVPLVPRKRDLRGRSLARRCKPRPATTNSTSIASSTSSQATSSSVAVPVNVGSNPASISSSKSSEQATPTPSSTPVDTPPPSPTPTPTPTPTPAPAPSSSSSEQAPAPSSSASSSSSGSAPDGFLAGTQNGQGTFYATGLGACGITNNDSQNIVAVSHLLFDSFPGYNGVNPNSNPVCNKQIVAEYQGKSVTVTVTDRCEGCAMTDLDFSPTAFDTLADPSLGRINIQWHWA